MSATLEDDIKHFVGLALQSRVKAGKSARVNSALGVTSSSHGISRALIQERLRRYWRTDWSLDRVTAVVTELVARGAYRLTPHGYRTSWERLEALKAAA
jgi:hypothetical protein